MPKIIPIITDWSAEERLALVKRWHPAPTYQVTEEPGMAANDQETWYSIVSLTTVANVHHDTTKGNNRFYKLTVETCQKELTRIL